MLGMFSVDYRKDFTILTQKKKKILRIIYRTKHQKKKSFLKNIFRIDKGNNS